MTPGGYIQVYHGVQQADGDVTKGDLVLLARESTDAMAFCVKSTNKCFVVIGPRGGRLVYTRGTKNTVYVDNCNQRSVT